MQASLPSTLALFVGSPNLGEQLGGAQLASFDADKVNYVCVDTVEKQRELVERLMGVKMFAFDTETTSLDVLDAELVGMSFAIQSTVNSQQTIVNCLRRIMCR